MFTLFLPPKKVRFSLLSPKMLVSFSWLAFFIAFCLYNCLNAWFISSQCLHHQKPLLLELKSNLTFNPGASDKLVGWSESSDCCQWKEVECDNSSGRVIGLDLSEKDITGSMDNFRSMSHLEFLQRLNLANNYIKGEIPSAFGELSSLTYLNLSGGNFSGQVPIEISHLLKLEVLDISHEYRPSDNLYMIRPTMATIIRNLSNIKELYLDGVDISTMGNTWLKALSSSLPHLQVLSMYDCGLRGEIHTLISELRHLSIIHLDHNQLLHGPIPDGFAKLTNLTTLTLSNCDLTGVMPENIFHVPTLTTLDLSWNAMLRVTLPVFKKNGSIVELILSGTNFSGHLSSSIANLKRLHTIHLSLCNIQGSIPSIIGSLSQLEDLDLSQNQFSGPIPMFSSANNMKFIALGNNNLSGSITATNWGKLVNLVELDLSSNNLEGTIPKSIFHLPGLMLLDLHSNRFSGKVKLCEFLHSLNNVTDLVLSHNLLSIDTNGCDISSTFPQLYRLGLASCNLSILPEFLINQTSLFNLDLSMNQISGLVPSWIWEVGYSYLNLSFNYFEGVEPPVSFHFNTSSLLSLDLQSNNLQGKFPIVASNQLYYLDCSNNNITSIDPNLGKYISEINFFSFSRNNLHGNIPTALCNATHIQLLNLEHNHLSGTIPDCLLTMTQLSVLNIRENSLRGVMPDKFREGCSLQTLDFNGNYLQGRIPLSLDRCEQLMVLDLGHNRLNDTFPCHLKNLSKLQVLVLRSNIFHGTIVCPWNHPMWPLLHIVDLASNHFSGEITSGILLKWTSTMARTYKGQSEPSYIQSQLSMGYYQDLVAVTFRGTSYELNHILTIFTSIDLSNNSFHGNLPRELGNLNALLVLNFSHNSFSGHIPSSIGNLSQIESLDLSCNAFTGNIPPQLANLNFLAYLNLSFNKLSGLIPTGTQLQSFKVSSYEGNLGLHGPPLTPISKGKHVPITATTTTSQDPLWSSKSQLEWMLRGTEVGFPVGLTIILGPLLYIKRYREWYCNHLQRLVMKIMHKEDTIARGRIRRDRQRRQRR